MKTEKSRQWTSQVIKPALTQRGTITNETRGQHNLHNNASNQLLVVRHEGSPDGISLLPDTWFRCCPAPLSPAAGLTFAGEDRRCAQKWESKDQGFLNRQEAWFRFFPDEWTRYWTMVNEIREITAALALPDHWRVRGYGIGHWPHTISAAVVVESHNGECCVEIYIWFRNWSRFVREVLKWWANPIREN